MKNINRIFQNKISQYKKDELKENVRNYILNFTNPMQIYFYGSILTEDFDSYSDIDVLVVYNDSFEATRAIKKLQNKRENLNLDFPIEFVCVSKEKFDQKSKIGGLYFVVAQEGEAVI